VLLYFTRMDSHIINCDKMV